MQTIGAERLQFLQELKTGLFTSKLFVCSFPKDSQRPRHGKGKLPGPGEYKLKPDLGPQMNSKRLNSPRASFPQAVKEQSDKVCLRLNFMYV